MKQSKLLKKSLAALLAILMVAAMIPMSAFAEEAPDAPAEKPAYIESLKLGVTTADTEATWDAGLGENGGFKVALSGIRTTSTNNAEDTPAGKGIKVSWVRAVGNSGKTLSVVKANNVTAAVGGVTNPSTLALTTAIEHTADSPETGEYTFNLTDGTTTWPLVIDWTRREAETDATLRRVNYKKLANVLDAAISGNKITLTMAFGVTGAINKKDSASATPSPDEAPSYFIPTAGHSTIDLATANKVKVNAENGAQEIYDIVYAEEAAITNVTMDGQVGETAYSFDGTTRTFTIKMPYMAASTSAATLSDKEVSLEFGDNVTEVKTNATGNTSMKDAKGGKLTFAAESASNTATETAYKATLKDVSTTLGTSTNKKNINVIVLVPTSNPEAVLNTVRFQVGNAASSSITWTYKGQTVVIPEASGNQTINVVLPYDTDFSKEMKISLDGSVAAQYKVNSTEGEFDGNSPLTGGAADITIAPLDANAATRTIIVELQSEDKSAEKRYTFNLSKADKNADKNLESVSISGTVNGEKVTYAGVKDATGNFTITVPYSLGTGDWTEAGSTTYSNDFALTGWTVSATGTPGQTLSFSGVSDEDWAAAPSTPIPAINSTVVLNSGTTVMDQIFVGSSTKDDQGTVTAKYGFTAGDSIVASISVGGTPRKVTIKRDAANKTGIIESAAVSAYDSKSAAKNKTDDVTTTNYDAAAKTITVDMPYSKGTTFTNLYFSELKLSTGAKAILVPTTTTGAIPASNYELTAWNADGTTAAPGIAKSTYANFVKQAGATGIVPVEIWVFSEDAWKNITLGTTTYDAASSLATTKYKLSGTYAAPATGAQLLNIASTADPNVTVETKGTEITITVPNSYVADATDFGLDFTLSDKATLYQGNNAFTVGKEIASDEGEANKGTRFKVGPVSGVNKLIAKKTQTTNPDDTFDSTATEFVTVRAEDTNRSTPYSIFVKVAPVQTSAELTSLLVGETAAEADPDNDTAAVKAWKVTLPYGSSLKQVLTIAASSMATIEVDGIEVTEPEEFDLTDGATIKVTSEDKKTTNTYKLTVAFGEPSTEADITAAKVGEVEATIAGETITAVVAEDFDFTQAVAVSFEVSEGAKVTKLGEAAPTETYTFTDGEAVAVEVTAQDGKTTKTYQLVVTTKKPSSENTITELTVDGIAATIAEEAITAEAENPASVTLDITLPEGAIAKVGDVEYTAGMTVDATEAVTIVVTAEDGTEKTYTLTVTKKAEQPKPGLDDVNDVPADHWAAEAIADILSRGIMTPNSKGNFRPNETVSRGMFAVMMCQLYGVNPEDYADAENPYTDIKKGDWFYNAALAAVANDWMTGTSSTTFSPKEPVTREQTALIIAKAQGLSKVEAPAELYSDDAQIASWAKGWVYACKDADLISYMSASQKTFNPKGDLTRAQIATILTKIHPDTEKPDEPENPDEGNNPENPDEGNNPENPDEGNNPENPDEGNTPENPDEGNNPENPDEGNNPENPDEGSNPENPDEGNTPENPDEGNTPETPDEGETPAE